MPYSLRPAAPGDLEEMMRIGHAGIRPWVEALRGWDQAEEERRFRDDFDVASIGVVQIDGRDVGYVRVETHADHLLVAGVYLDAAVRGSGVGSAIVRDVLTRARATGMPVRLRVLRSNPARRLYERLGFRVVRESDTLVHMEAAPHERSGLPGGCRR